MLVAGATASLTQTPRDSTPFALAVSLAAALATLAAVYYAYEAAAETRSLRQEDRLATLLDVTGELCEYGYLVMNGDHGSNRLRAEAAKMRLQAAIAATQAIDAFPACTELLSVDFMAIWNSPQRVAEQRGAEAKIAAALDELASQYRGLAG